MPRLFAVIRTRGSNWNPPLSPKEQDDWRGRANIVNALHAEGSVLLGGPLEGTSDVLLITRAKDTEEIQRRLLDSWTRKGLLTVKCVQPWDLRLAALG
jgi:hypothetical protein